MSFTIGSLFDGSGGFPLAATMCGGTPKWASEIEPYPIAVTKSRFPGIKHLGSVTDINGAEVEPVDVITFGSPCQDLSVAGKRAGLKHEANGDDETTRSGLFMEAVRIIKEMREATNGVYPRFALWENVPGAFSSNKGEDFRIVLEELIKVVEPSAVMPEVPKNGWPYADSYCGDGWSIAYRVLDAQFWGVPQRRRRIYLVADFRGECAGKISFECEGLRGYFETGRTPWQTVAGDAESGSGATDCEGDGVIAVDQGGGKSGANFHDNLSPTLTCTHGGEPVVAYSVENHPADSRVNLDESGKVQTLTSRMGTGGGNVPMVMEPFTFDARGNGDGKTVSTITGCHEAFVSDFTSVVGMPIQDAPVYCLQGNGIDRADTAGCNGKGVKEDVCYTLNTIDRPAVAFQTYQKVTGLLMANSHPGSYTGQDAFSDMLVAGVDARNATEYPELTGALQADAAHNLNSNNVVRIQYIVRRLTPTECARLQGFPDRWGHPDEKTEFTDEEYQFWCKVNLDLAIIGGTARPNDDGWYNVWREVKPDTKKGEDFEPYDEDTGKPYTHKNRKQMLSWYNKLHTDSSEYKMWGNGIALPNALYMMQGIAEVMSEEKTARRKWLDDLLGGCL